MPTPGLTSAFRPGSAVRMAVLQKRSRVQSVFAGLWLAEVAGGYMDTTVWTCRIDGHLWQSRDLLHQNELRRRSGILNVCMCRRRGRPGRNRFAAEGPHLLRGIHLIAGQ